MKYQLVIMYLLNAEFNKSKQSLKSYPLKFPSSV
jgi:hypothetical protein